jgi:hypothetical protein
VVADQQKISQGLHWFTACAVLLSVASAIQAQRQPAILRPEEARHHIGEYATVCGYVAAVHEDKSGAVLDFSEPQPVRIFNAIIAAADRSQFGDVQRNYANRHLCVTGAIRKHGEDAVMQLRHPRQIAPVSPKRPT